MLAGWALCGCLLGPLWRTLCALQAAGLCQSRSSSPALCAPIFQTPRTPAAPPWAVRTPAPAALRLRAHPAQCFQRITALGARAVAYYTRAAAARQLLFPASAEPPPADAAAGARRSGAGAPAGSSGGAGGGGSHGAAVSAGLEALECLLLWLACYSDLFTRPCSATGKLLCWEPCSAVPLPPVVRPFK